MHLNPPWGVFIIPILLPFKNCILFILGNFLSYILYIQTYTNYYRNVILRGFKIVLSGILANDSTNQVNLILFQGLKWSEIKFSSWKVHLSSCSYELPKRLSQSFLVSQLSLGIKISGYQCWLFLSSWIFFALFYST